VAVTRRSYARVAATTRFAPSDAIRAYLRTVVTESAVALLTSLAAALATTWPLATMMTSAVPLGTQRVATVPFFEMWQLWWTADRAPHLFEDYWNAPIFHPNPGTFSYSEPQPLTALMVAPLWGWETAPALIYNVALLSALTLNGYFAFRLLRALHCSARAALLGAVLVITAPYFAKIVGVLNLVPIYGFLWALEGLVRFGNAGRTRNALWAGAGLLALYLTCEQYALMCAPFFVVAIGVALGQQQYAPTAVRKLVVGVLPIGVALAWLALPTLRLHEELGLRRTDELVRLLSARPLDLLTRPGTASVGWPDRSWDDTGGLLPGILVFAAAVLGSVATWRQSWIANWVRFLATSAVAATLLALGMNLELAGWSPFSTLRAWLPGYDELRSPYRFVVVVQTTLCVLAGLGLAHLERIRCGLWSTPLVMVALGMFAAGENLAVFAPQATVPLAARTEWTDWLADQPAGVVVAHLPFPGGLHVSDYEQEAQREFRQIAHHRPMVNGYSSFFPSGYTRFQLEIARAFPSDADFCFLRDTLGVNTIVADQSWLARWRNDASASQMLELRYSGPDVQIFEMRSELSCLH
jgi:hypothetical protein